MGEGSYMNAEEALKVAKAELAQFHKLSNHLLKGYEAQLKEIAHCDGREWYRDGKRNTLDESFRRERMRRKAEVRKIVERIRMYEAVIREYG